MMKAKKPTTLFSLIELLSLNNSLKNFFIIFGNLLNNKYQKKHYLLKKTYNMAKVNTGSNSSVKLETSKVSRPGVHSKTKTSKLKQSKNYKKSYKGQGK